MQLEVIEPEKRSVKFQEEPLISFIVPVHAKNLDVSIFKRCLMSLDDQDYPNMEVVIVLNGGKDEAIEKVAQHFVSKDNVKFRFIQTDEAGACNARNLGFEHSKGDIVSFFNSDYRAKPGMVQMWVDELVSHPDCGFIYSGYEYSTVPATGYGSKPFNPFLLKQANYIDCGFPLWRKHVVKWDPEVRSLQDWDFWLRVVNSGTKGHFIDRELSFIAEPPRAKGLSDDSDNNWIDRVNFVKEKNGVKLSDLLVTSLGASFHGQQIAQMLGADFRDDTIYKKNAYKALYMIGFYLKPTDKGNEHPKILASFSKDVKKIIHFVGADIFWLRKFPYESLKLLTGVMKMGSDYILCENEQAQSELKDMGIEAKIVPLPTYNEYEFKPLPETFKVSLYLTERSDFDKYLMKHTLSIVKAMPDIEFTGYGDGAKDFHLPNFKHYGNMELAAYKNYVYENSCLLRLVRHDTLPMAACDFALAGRDVISNIPMPYTHTIDTSGTTPLDMWDKFSPGFNSLRWPETKSKIIQMIRNVKHSHYDHLSEVKGQIDFYKDLLDRKKYIDTIYGLAGLKGGK